MRTSRESKRRPEQFGLSRGYRTALVLLLFIALTAPMTMAGPTDERHGIITMVLPDGTIDSDGDWRLHIVSIGQFERDGWEFSAHKDDIITRYLAAKGTCGDEGVFYNEIRELTADERGSITCVIDGVMNDTHCNTTTSAIQDCIEYIPYKIEDDYAHDRKLMTFKSFYDSHMYDIGRADFYHHYATESCVIDNGTCVMRTFIREGMANPMMVVLEDTLSREKAYFSEPMNIGCYDAIDAATASTCEQYPCEAEIPCEEEIATIATDGTTLRIEFRDHAPQDLDEYDNGGNKSGSNDKSRSIVQVVAIIIIICLIASILYFMHRRSNR